MPSWISSSDVERAMWLDTTLQTLWPNIAKSSQGWLMDYMEPMLKNSNTGIIPSIVVKELNLGAVPPKITGVRNIKTTESMVRLDVEFVWAAVPEVNCSFELCCCFIYETDKLSS
jgi:Ca2+-dependent lipid-binding protein